MLDKAGKFGQTIFFTGKVDSFSQNFFNNLLTPKKLRL